MTELIRSLILAALVSAMLAGAAASASAEPADVTVDQALALYRAHSPRLAAARADIEVAGADRVEARIYPNPTLGLGGTRTVTGTDTIGGTQLALSLDVPLLIGHQRARREDAAKLHVDAVRAEVAATQAEAELDVRARFATLVAAQEGTLVLAAALADARTLRDVVAARTSAGAGSPYAVDRIDLAIAALASRVEEAKSLELAASGELAALVGLAGWQPHAIGDVAGVALPDAIAADHPVLAENRAELGAARAQLDRARADAVPTPSVGLQTFGTTDPSGLAIGAGVSIPLPLFDRNQGAVARARADAHKAALELDARTAELSLALANARRVLAARRASLAQFREGALVHLDRLRAMAEASYKNGQGSLVDLLDALEAITDARLRELELRRSAAEAELDVRRAALGR